MNSAVPKAPLAKAPFQGAVFEGFIASEIIKTQAGAERLRQDSVYSATELDLTKILAPSRKDAKSDTDFEDLRACSQDHCRCGRTISE